MPTVDNCTIGWTMARDSLEEAYMNTQKRGCVEGVHLMMMITKQL